MQTTILGAGGLIVSSGMIMTSSVWSFGNSPTLLEPHKAAVLLKIFYNLLFAGAFVNHILVPHETQFSRLPIRAMGRGGALVEAHFQRSLKAILQGFDVGISQRPKIWFTIFVGAKSESL